MVNIKFKGASRPLYSLSVLRIAVWPFQALGLTVLVVGLSMAQAKPYRSPFEVLGVPASATDAEVKSAYRKLAKQHHPDMFYGADPATRKFHEEAFKEINEAYESIKDQPSRLRLNRADQPGQQPSDSADDKFREPDSETLRQYRSQVFSDYLFHSHQRAEITWGEDSLMALLRTFFDYRGESMGVSVLVEKSRLRFDEGELFPQYLYDLHRDYFEQLARRIPTLKDAPIPMNQFVDSFLTGRYATAVLSYLENLEREIRVGTKENRSVEALTEFTERVSGELIEALPKICANNLKSCTLSLARQLSAHSGVRRVMGIKAKERIIAIIDQVLDQDIRAVFMSTEYFSLMQTRQRFKADLQSPLSSAIDCARVLGGHFRVSRELPH